MGIEPRKQRVVEIAEGLNKGVETVRRDVLEILGVGREGRVGRKREDQGLNVGVRREELV